MRLQYRGRWHVCHVRNVGNDGFRSPVARVPFNIFGFISERFCSHSIFAPEEAAPVECDGVGVIALLRVSVRNYIVVSNVVPGLQIVNQAMNCGQLHLGILLAAGVVHLDSNTVVVVDSRQCLEYVDVNRTQIRIGCLIDCTVSIYDILSARMAATARTPTLDHSHGTYRNPGFGRVHNDMFDLFTTPVDATTHGVAFDDACPHQHACVILIGGSVGEGAHDVGRLIIGQRALIEVRCFHQKHVGVICVAWSALVNDVMRMFAPVMA